VSTVYIVSRGKDCIAIEGVFSNKEKAQEYIDYFKGTTTYTDINEEIAEYELDNVPDYIKNKEYSWYIQMDKEGEVRRLDKQEFHEPWFSFIPVNVADNTKEYYLAGYIHAEYRDEAITILNEQRKWTLDKDSWGDNRVFRSS
jgi:hypothetical protein